MIAVSFYTDDRYKAAARNLETSLKNVGIDCQIESAPDLGSWSKNVLQKPSFIQRKLRENPERDILWLDADSIVHSRPVLLDGDEFDFAAYRRIEERFWGGTLFFRNTPLVRKMIDSWVKTTAYWPERTDDGALSDVVLSEKGLRLLDLPMEYCWVERFMRNVWPWKVPVIEQYAIGFYNGSWWPGKPGRS